MKFNELFPTDFPIIGCVHLNPLPGSPGYLAKLEDIYQKAIDEAKLLAENGVHGLIVENYGDTPFYPSRVPVETVASMSAVIKEIVKIVDVPVGVNVLRNDAKAALAIAHATHAHFIRVNVHMHAMLTDQGLIQGESYETLRLKAQLHAQVQIWADIKVKHAQPIVEVDLAQWTADLAQRGGVDALIVTGPGTGQEVQVSELTQVKSSTDLPVLVGSGSTAQNIGSLIKLSDGVIVGTHFKRDGITTNDLDPSRINNFMKQVQIVQG